MVWLKKGAKRNVKKNTQNHIQQLERLSPAKTTTTFLIVDTMRKETTRRQLVITLTTNSADALRLKMERLSRLTVILMTTANPSLPQKNGLCQMKVLEKG